MLASAANEPEPFHPPSIAEFFPQVFLFMEAAQGDQRTNVMQAPKITLFSAAGSAPAG